MTGVKFRLSVMMFLQYAIWGAWLPILWPYLAGHRGFTASEITDMFAVGAVGAIVAPFVAGQIADRYFATEKFLALSHILGGLLIWQLASIESYWGFLCFSLLYSIIYAPTLSLTNSISFHHLPDRDRDFGRVRVWGTIGWIVVGIAVGQWLLYQYSAEELDLGRADAFRLSAILGMVLGLYCLFLPHTPPQKGEQQYATGEALGEIRRNPLLTLFLLAVPVSCIHQFYFVHTAGFLTELDLQAPWIDKLFGVGGGGLMTVGQICEIAVLAVIPLVARKVPRKVFLAVGLLAYAFRMFAFSYATEIQEALGVPIATTIITGIAMHGFCFGCFIFVAFMIVDEECTGDVKASAQGLFNLVTVGIGIIVGSKIAGWVADWASEVDALGVEGMDYRRLFNVPMWASLACLVVLLLFYPLRSRRRPEPPTP